MCIYVQELIETLVAWSLSTHDLLLACYVASGYALRIRYKLSDARHSWEQDFFFGITPFYKWIAHVVRAWDLGSAQWLRGLSFWTY
jgi:hypothetical protein